MDFSTNRNQLFDFTQFFVGALRPGKVRRPPNNTTALRRYTERYRYDSGGNIEAMVHEADGAGNTGWTRRYRYDKSPDNIPKSNRLQSTSVPGDNPDGPYSAAYSHDAHGNMTRMPHLRQMTWDHADQLQSVDLGGGGAAHYQYDLAGERIRKVVRKGTVDEERIYLGGFEIFRRRRGNGIEFERETLHVFDDDKRIALVETKTHDGDARVREPRSRQRFQFRDHLGSCSLELTGEAALITYEEYFAFGGSSMRLARANAEVGAKRYRYNGKECDSETGLHYYGARYYGEWLARWTAADPVSHQNRFAYVSNNPVQYIDPDGADKSWWQNTVEGVHAANKFIRETAFEAGGQIVDAGEALIERAGIKNARVRSAIRTGTTLTATTVATGLEVTATVLMTGPNVLAELDSAGKDIGVGTARVIHGDTTEEKFLGAAQTLGGLGTGASATAGLLPSGGGPAAIKKAVSPKPVPTPPVLAKTKALLKDAATTPKPVRTPPVSAKTKAALDKLSATKRTAQGRIGATGKVGEAALKQLVGGKSQVFFPTSTGARFIDQLAKGIAHESKVGRTSLTKAVKRQIAKDVELKGNDVIRGSVWHFFPSPATGKVGPTGPLKEALRSAGIGFKVH